LVDQPDEWRTTLWTRGLETLWSGVPAPESVTVSVTPRRLQSFAVPANATVAFDVVRRGAGATVQSGEVLADGSGVVTVPGVKVYRDGSVLRLRVPAVTGVAPSAIAAPDRLDIRVGRNPVREACPVTVAWPGSGAAHLALVDVSGRVVRGMFDGPTKPGIVTLDLE